MTGDGVVEYLLARAADPVAHGRWAEQARSTGWCSHPVRLTGSTVRVDPATGEVTAAFTTAEEPDGTLLKACGQRRATACQSCSVVYRSDAYHLVAAGLRGGKGVADGVASHPRVFVTLTAPSFGPVHSRRLRDGVARACHMGAPCPHSGRIACGHIHEPGDPALGTPLCPGCFDYRAAVLWNASATELWRRTTIAVRRHLASRLDVPTRQLARHARLSYVKVVEYQARGVVHIHAVVRLDGADGGRPGEVDVADLTVAVASAAHAVTAPWPEGAGLAGVARWGNQLDVRPLGGTDAPDGAVAAYVAKYATKSTDGLGRLDHRLRASQLAELDLPEHLARLVRTAWELGGEPALSDLRLRAWAHTLGFRGHWLTKSRAYSTSFGALRAARALHVAERRGEALDPESVAVKDWRFVGRGWANPGDALLADTAAAHRFDARKHARQERIDNKTQQEENHGQAAAHP